jgi:hypothetical protein
MSIIKKLQQGWKAMPTVKKVKICLDFVAQVGCGFLGGDISRTFSEGKKPLAKVCYYVAGYGLGCAMGDAASKAMDETIDSFVTMNELRKEGNKEEKANG